MTRKLESFAHEVATCTFCPKMCRFSCPVDRVEHDEAVTPTGKQTALYLLERGELDWTPDVASVFYKCTGCRIQQTFCDHRIDVTPVFRAAREVAVARGVAPEAVAAVRERFAANGHLHDAGAVARGMAEIGEFMSTTASTDGGAAGDDVYFPGCTVLAKRPDVARDFFRLVDACGLPRPRLFSGARICCGMPLSDAGLEAEFRVHAAAVHAALAGGGSGGSRAPRGRIIVADPDCASTLRDRYREVGFDFGERVVPVVAYLHNLRERLARVLKPREVDVVYHDSCHLARVFGITNEPRALLRLAVAGKIAEPFHARAAATCSGAGGIFPETSPASARAIAELAACELREAAPDKAVFVGSCASAETHLEQSNRGMKVRDLVSVLADALP